MDKRPDNRQIRVVIVDDHPVVRDGTLASLQEDPSVTVVGVAGDGATTIQLVSDLQPDVLLLDLHLPDMSGIEVARRVRTAFPQIAVLVLTGYDENAYIQVLLDLGVQGYLRKTIPSREIVAAIHTVVEGKTILAPEAAKVMSAERPEQLTKREYAVLQLLATGRGNAEIASTLGVTVKTVEYHVSRLLEKLGVQSRGEAIYRAQQRGLIGEHASEGYTTGSG